MKLLTVFLAVGLARLALGANGDFFDAPEKKVVAKGTPTPGGTTAPPAAPLTPTPLVDSPIDRAYLQTGAVGGARSLGAAYFDIGPDYGVLIGFEYSTSITEGGATIIQTLQPIYVREAGKVRGTLRGQLKAGIYGTMLESRPGYAVAAVDAVGDSCLQGFQVTFMRYLEGKLDPSESYASKWCGLPGGPTTRRLATDTRPFSGVYGKAGSEVNEFGLLVRKVAASPAVAETSPPKTSGFFGTPMGRSTTTPPLPSMPEPLVSRATPMPRILPTPTPPPPVGGAGQCEVFAGAGGNFELFLNGQQILTDKGERTVQTGTFPIVRGDVIAAVVKDAGLEEAWFSLRIVRGGRTVLDAGDMRYLLNEPPSWKLSKLVSSFREPKTWTHAKQMGDDPRPRAVWSGPKDAGATTLFLKAVVP